jgi:hypothetical protein
MRDDPRPRTPEGALQEQQGIGARRVTRLSQRCDPAR